MRKLAALAAAAAFLFAAPVVMFILSVDFAQAQDAVAAVEPGPWDQFWVQVQAPLAAFALAVLGALGSVVSYYAKQLLGANASKAVTAVWQMGTDAAAGYMKTWLANHPDEVGKPLTLDSLPVKAATEFFKASFPKAVAAVEPTDHEIGSDILASFGRMLPGPFGMIAGVAGSTLLKPKTVAKRPAKASK